MTDPAITRTPVTAVVDVETTGLDPRIHQPYEVSVWRSDHLTPTTLALPHTLEYADPFGLTVGGYHARGFKPWPAESGAGREVRAELIDLLADVNIIGSNPSFDAAMLTRFIGCQVWSHRLIDVAQAAMWVLGYDQPRGLAKVVEHLTDLGFPIPTPDHTAEGDVRATRAVYQALLILRPHPTDGAR